MQDRKERFTAQQIRLRPTHAINGNISKYFSFLKKAEVIAQKVIVFFMRDILI